MKQEVGMILKTSNGRIVVTATHSRMSREARARAERAAIEAGLPPSKSFPDTPAGAQRADAFKARLDRALGAAGLPLAEKSRQFSLRI